MQKLAVTSKGNGTDTKTAFVSHMSDSILEKVMIK